MTTKMTKADATQYVRDHSDQDDLDQDDLDAVFAALYGRQPNDDDREVGIWSLCCAAAGVHDMTTTAAARGKCVAVQGTDAPPQPPTVCGKTVQYDASGVGHNWRTVAAADLPADVRQEIECEILDGGKDECSDYVASNGLHYRWS